MAGHSKWAQIKRKKGAADAKRGQLFTKLARAITVAARDGGGDPDGNAALANAIEKAKSLRMPKENIERAIAKGTGAGGDAAAIEAVTYEGYGPGGVAILIECLTDNRNRTAADIRHMFSRADASLGEPGSVAWMFEKKGVLLVDAGRYSEDDLMPAIDAGAEDLAAEGDSIRIVCEAADLRAVRDALEQAGVEVQSTEQSMLPKTTVEVEAGRRAQAAAAARRARRAGRRRPGARELRHPRRGAGGGRGGLASSGLRVRRGASDPAPSLKTQLSRQVPRIPRVMHRTRAP